MILSTTILSLTMAMVLIFLGFFLEKKSKNALFISMSGGVLAVVVGLLLFSNPIEYQSGSNSTIINDTITTAIQYTTINNQTGTIINWVSTLVGLAVVIITVLRIYDRRFEEEETYNW